MKIKLNWGTSIVIAIALFMAFILSFLYKAVAVDKYEHHLVSDDYYKDELHYQEEIDKLKNALKLTNNIVLKNSTEGIDIHFPEDKDYDKIEGTITFLKLSNKKLDFKKNITLENHHVLIPDSILVKGKWHIKIDWTYAGEAYMLKESWFY